VSVSWRPAYPLAELAHGDVQSDSGATSGETGGTDARTSCQITRSLHSEDLQQSPESFPVVASPLAAAIEHPDENPLYLIVKVIEAVEISAESVVLVITSQLGTQLCEEGPFVGR
jgi:hypothetical protein